MKSEVLDLLSVTRLLDGKRILNSSLEFVDATGLGHRVRAGFKTDYSSIPSALHWIVRWSKVDYAGVVHDHLYCTKDVPRKVADQTWREVAMKGRHRANALQAWVCYLGLRAFGWMYWRKG